MRSLLSSQKFATKLRESQPTVSIKVSTKILFIQMVAWKSMKFESSLTDFLWLYLEFIFSILYVIWNYSYAARVKVSHKFQFIRYSVWRIWTCSLKLEKDLEKLPLPNSAAAVW